MTLLQFSCVPPTGIITASTVAIKQCLPKYLYCDHQHAKSVDAVPLSIPRCPHPKTAQIQAYLPRSPGFQSRSLPHLRQLRGAGRAQYYHIEFGEVSASFGGGGIVGGGGLSIKD